MRAHSFSFLLVSVIILFFISPFLEAKKNNNTDIAELITYIPAPNNRTIHIAALKPFQDCAIIFIHGLFGSTTHWYYQYNLWSKKCSTVTFDIYGHGLSSGILVKNDPTVIVQDIKTVLAWTKAKKYVLVGHNYGGMGVQQYAITTKDPKMSAIVLVDSFARNPNPYREGGDQKIVELLAAQVFKQAAILEALEVLVSPAQPKDLPVKSWQNVAGAGLIANYRAVNQIILTNHSFLVNTVTTPVFIVYGTDDNIANKENWPEVKKAYQNSKLVPIQGGSHSPFLQLPVIFNGKLTDILSQVPDWDKV